MAVFLMGNAHAKVFPFNEQKIPKTKEDLLAIQSALGESLPRAREATVSIKLGQGFGSGVIVSPDGLILTAAHVSGGVKKKLTVIMNDGTEHKAISMGLVSNTDAAMMKIIDPGEYPYVEINKDNDYRLGHWVFALGHSGGYDKARGPVVRLGRIVKDSEATLHTDCKVIGGDSGGPLFAMDGRLIAIHSRVGRGSLEENMHVPMREYLKHWKEMQENKFLGDGPFAQKPVKGSGFIGILTEDSDHGVRIVKVGKDMPGEKAGLKVDDIILKVEDTEVADKNAFKSFLKEKSEGDELVFEIKRDGEVQKITVTLGKR